MRFFIGSRVSEFLGELNKVRRDTTADELFLVQAFIRHIEKKHGKLSYKVPSTIIIILKKYIVKPALIIANGSGFIKAGIAGADDIQPSVIIPTVYGIERDYSMHYQTSREIDVNRPLQRFIGEEALKRDGFAVIKKYPIQHGIVCDWDYIEPTWRHIIEDELKVSPENHPVFMTETPLNPKANREKMTQIMFEYFNVPKFYLAVDAELSLYATGTTTGIVCSSGDSISHAVPIHDGNYLPDATLRLDLGGKDVFEHLTKLLGEKEPSLSSMNTFQRTKMRPAIIKIKEKMCYVAQDFANEMKKDGDEQGYELPDGKVIKIDNERFKAPEIIFEPSMIGLNESGLHKLLNDSIKKCNEDLRQELYENIVIAGGNTKFDGFAKRLYSEMKSLASDDVTVEIVAPENRQYLSWIGANILTSWSTFDEMWILKEEYDEIGPTIIHQKCK